MNDVIVGEVVEEPGQEIAVREQGSVTLFGTDDPAEVVARATRTAAPLAAVVRQKNLSVDISGREHVRVEGWTLLGSMLGVFPVCVWTRKLKNGWEARVEARLRDGSIVGAAEAECLRSESRWADRDDYALRSMAQTRATSKALRQPLGFVMQLAGFEATPAEEMPQGSDQHQPRPSDKQLAYLSRLVADAGVNWSLPDDLTRSQASALIEQLKNGDTSGLVNETCPGCGGINGVHADGCEEDIPF